MSHFIMTKSYRITSVIVLLFASLFLHFVGLEADEETESSKNNVASADKDSPAQSSSKNDERKEEESAHENASSNKENERHKNLTSLNGTSDVTPSSPTTPGPKQAQLPPHGEQEKEHKSSMAIFFILFVIVLSILLVHLLLFFRIHYIPESLAIVSLGAAIGAISKLGNWNWTQEEAFSPNAFFLLLLPPIIFEGGYNLHKGNFFANLGSILVFAIVGTGVSAAVVGGGVFLLGQADLIYELSAVESFAFGAMISAVDPVATLAIFQALHIDPILYMLVFGESMLNDAVAIVLTSTVLELRSPEMRDLSASGALLASLGRFSLMFFASAGLGIAAGLMSALLLKHVDLRKTPSLEFGIMLVFAYLPYGLAEGIHLSGIMAILFCGITMSHYTHLNLSPMTQITMQQTFRTLAFIAETCVFAYLGMAFFTFPLIFRPVFIIWSLILILLGRAVNIFPLSMVVNLFREHKITKKMQFIMWFSGLRGAIAVALSMHMEFDGAVTRRMMITSTLTIVIFTTVILGGGTLPLIQLLNRWQAGERPQRRKRTKRRRKQRRGSSLTLSKTREMGQAMEADYSDYTTDGGGGGDRSLLPREGAAATETALSGLAHFDACYLRPFFVRKFTQQEKKESTLKLTDLALKWYQAQEESRTDEEDEEETIFFQKPSESSDKPSSAARLDSLPSSDNDQIPLI